MRTFSRLTAMALLMGLLAVPAAEARTHIYVRIGPPAPIVEQRIVAPAPDYVWQPGYHRWASNSYVWVPGTWARPPYRRAHWVEGHWVHTRHGYYWEQGYWARGRRY